MIDVSGMLTEAQPIVQRAAEIYLRHTRPWFIGLLAHGSSVKGGIIPGCSDIDLQLYLENTAFVGIGSLPLAVGLAIRRELGKLDPSPFRCLQCMPRPPHPVPGWVGPIPGAYRLIAGRLPIPEASAADLHQSAQQALETLNPEPGYITNSLLGPGGGRFERNVRLLCTQVWPILYQVLTLQGEDPLVAWCLPKERAIRRLPQGSPLSEAIHRFYRALWVFYPAEKSLEDGFAVIEAGISFLQAAKNWWIECRAQRTLTETCE